MSESAPVFRAERLGFGYTPEIQALVKSISDHYSKAQAALRNSDFATYGAELDAMSKDLAKLRDLTGVTLP